MKTVPTSPRVIEAERLEDGVIITFDDGKHAIFPASLLRANLPQAEAMSDSKPEE
jgi:DUF971 family protein